MAGSKLTKGQNGPRVKMGQGSRVLLTPLKSRTNVEQQKRETNGRVKMSQESKWATVVYL